MKKFPVFITLCAFASMTLVACGEDNSVPAPIYYTVSFKNYDGSLLSESIVMHGGTVTYDGVTPTRGETSEYTYTFSGWDQSLENITSNCSRIAQYKETLKPVEVKYTVTFVNYDGTVLHEVYVLPGGTAIYEWADPVREETEEASYTFKGWDQPLTNITSDSIRVAEYNEIKKPVTTYYTVTFKNYDGSILTEAIVEDGGTATYDLVDDPIRPATSEFTYSFIGWDLPLDNIKSNCIRVAQYNETYVEYSVKFYSYDNTLLYTDYVHYQEKAVYYGDTPSKPATSTHYYTFDGWDKDLSCITKSITTKPVFIEHGVEKQITVNPNNGGDSGELVITYGEAYDLGTPSYPGFTFAGWFIDETTSIPSSGIWNYEDVTSVTAKWETGYFNFLDNGDNTVTVSLTELGKTVSEIIIPSEFEGKAVTNLGTDFARSNTNLTKITIPGSIKNIPDNSFYYCSNLEEVNFNEGLLTIGLSSFDHCSKLTKISFPSTLTTIGKYAFDYCSSLYQIFIPKSVTTINQYAFRYLGSYPYVCLEHQEIPSGWSSDWASSVTYYPGSIKIVDDEDYTYVYRSLYGDLTASVLRLKESVSTLQEYTFPTQIEDATDVRVAPYLFINNKYIRNIDLTGVTRIGGYAFESCSNLQSVTFSNSLTFIGNYAFRYCSSLTRVEFPNSLTEIQPYAFYSCSGLTYIYIPDSVITIGDSAFNYCSSSTIYTNAHSANSGWSSNYKGSQLTYFDFVSLNEIEIEDFNYIKQSYLGDERITITGLKDSAKQKKNIVIPNEIEGITDIRMTTNIFYSLTNLVSVDLGPIKSIPNNCFQYCSNLETVVLHEGLTSIGSNAFYNCSKLSSINIPNSLTSIGKFAFDYCSSIDEIFVPIGVTYIGAYAFDDMGKTAILMESSIEQSGWESNWYGKYTSNKQFIYDYVSSGTIGDFRYAKTSNGVTDTIYILGLTKESTNLNLVIPDQVEGISNIKIAAYAFYGNTTIKTVDLGNSVVSILGYAFAGDTSLVSVIIPLSCTVIRGYAFDSCKTTCVLNCEIDAQPSGWDSYWNRSGCQVVWSYVR